MPALVYTPVGWVEDVTPTSAANFNRMEAGIAAVTDAINALPSAGSPVWADVRTASAVNVNVASPTNNTDGLANGLAVNDRILLVGQTAPSQNGIWTYNGAGNPLLRAVDSASGDYIFGRSVYVKEGQVHGGSTWSYSGASGPTVGTTALAFRKLNQPVGAVVQASSTVAEGPAPTSNDVVYASCAVLLTPGTWMIWGCATLATNVPDGKQLALYNANAGAEIAESAGPASGIASSDEIPHTCFGVVPLTATTTIKLLGKRNGGSQLRVGYGGATLAGEQAIRAVRLA